MNTRYCVNSAGEYIGGFCGAPIPENAVEVVAPPEHAAQIWDGKNWGAIPVDPIQQIAELEASVTPRRLREAVLTGNHSFVESVDRQIAALRASL